MIELIERQRKAIEKLGGTLGLLNLPKQVLDTIANQTDFETKVKMLEFVAENKDKVDWASF